jgi:peptide/nickel transport system ATP-binding protein
MNLPATATPQEPILTLRGLRISVPLVRNRCELVKGVDLDLQAGQVTGLVGESGCGKSITANALLGLLPGPSANMQARQFTLRTGSGDRDLSTLGEPGWRQLRGRQLAMIFQEPQSALDPVFRIGQQMVRVITRHRRVDNPSAREIAVANLEDCGLADTARILASYPHQLSGGMRQRVLIALALACEPRVLIADEATSALDIASREQVLALLRRAASQRGIAILLISHDLAAVARICDQVLVMYAGRVVESGPSVRLLRQPQHPYTAMLLQATARVSAHPPVAVQPVVGRAADLARHFPGCSFAERCNRATETCRQHCPEPVSHGDQAGYHCCFHPLGER